MSTLYSDIEQARKSNTLHPCFRLTESHSASDQHVLDLVASFFSQLDDHNGSNVSLFNIASPAEANVLQA
jgi:hypothetical protein